MVENKLLLLVEDDATTRDLLALLLAAEGWRVQVAEDGETALAMLHHQPKPPDLVLCDLHLPGLRGADLAAALRAELHHRFLASPRLLLMTATPPNADSLSHVSHHSYDGVLVKPFTPSALEQLWSAPPTAAAIHTATHPSPPLPGNGHTPPGHQPVLDPTTLRKLQASMNSTALQSLYAFALADADDRLQRMTDAVHTADTTFYRAEAHALKGSCGMIGARSLAHLASQAEAEGLQSDATNKLAAMHHATASIRLMLKTLFPV